VTDDWPVFLGRVVRDASDPAAPTYTVDLKGRPYAGVVAARLAPPFDRQHPWVLLGGDQEGEAAAFELRVPPPEGGAPRTALEIEAGGALTTHGDLSVRGDLEVEGGVVELSVAPPSPGASTAIGRRRPTTASSRPPACRPLPPRRWASSCASKWGPRARRW
jgi:hypothetical protein